MINIFLYHSFLSIIFKSPSKYTRAFIIYRHLIDHLSLRYWEQKNHALRVLRARIKENFILKIGHFLQSTTNKKI